MTTITLTTTDTSIWVTVDPGMGEAYVLMRAFVAMHQAWRYVHQYTVNASARRFTLIVRDESTVGAYPRGCESA